MSLYVPLSVPLFSSSLYFEREGGMMQEREKEGKGERWEEIMGGWMER